jgi:LCP family protein required for cell wall assembly
LLIVLIVYPLSLAFVAWRNVTRAGELPAVADTPGTTYLLVGSDSRAGLSEQDVGYLNTGTEAEAGGQRTDTILVLHVPGGSQPPALISIPRDSYVAIPGRGENKINAAYAFGGAPLLAETVTGASGVGIDSYVETGLGGFARVTDAIGGVDLCLPEPITDPNAGIDLPAGCQTLNGGQALGLARSRKTDARGDLARVERQRAILSAIVDQAADPANVLNPFVAYPLASAGGSALTLDQDTGPIGVGRFVLAMRTIASGGGMTLTVPVANANLSTPAGSAVQWDEAGADALWAALRANDMSAVRAIAEAQESALNGAIQRPDQLSEQVSGEVGGQLPGG